MEINQRILHRSMALRIVLRVLLLLPWALALLQGTNFYIMNTYDGRWLASSSFTVPKMTGSAMTLNSGLAMTNAFNYQKDPQRRIVVKPSFDYIKSWYNSVKKFPFEIEGLVLHNMFSENFTSVYGNDQISFVKIDENTHPSFTEVENASIRSINNQVYFVMEWYLNQSYSEREMSALSKKADQYILMTDSHDVELLRNPFEYMRTNDMIMKSKQLYVGEEYNPSDGSYGWMKQNGANCFKVRYVQSRTIFNSGIIGGHISVIKDLLRQMNTMLLSTNTAAFCNMPVLNKVIHDHFQDDVVSGYPLHTKFRGFEETNSSAYIKHTKKTSL
jgi:hypothetical protein